MASGLRPKTSGKIGLDKSLHKRGEQDVSADIRTRRLESFCVEESNAPRSPRIGVLSECNACHVARTLPCSSAWYGCSGLIILLTELTFRTTCVASVVRKIL